MRYILKLVMKLVQNIQDSVLRFSQVAGILGPLIVVFSVVQMVFFNEFWDIEAISDLGVLEETKRQFRATLVGSAALLMGFSYFIFYNYKISKGFLVSYFIGLVSMALIGIIPADTDRPELLLGHFAVVLLTIIGTVSAMSLLGKHNKLKIPLFFQPIAVIPTSMLLFGANVASFIVMGTIVAPEAVLIIYFFSWIFFVALQHDNTGDTLH